MRNHCNLIEIIENSIPQNTDVMFICSIATAATRVRIITAVILLQTITAVIILQTITAVILQTLTAVILQTLTDETAAATTIR